GLRHLKGARQAKRADLVWPQADDFLAESGYRTSIGPVEAHDQIEGGGLACTVRPYQGQRLVFPHPKIDILHCVYPAKSLVQICDAESVGHGSMLSPVRRAIWCGAARKLPRGSP